MTPEEFLSDLAAIYARGPTGEAFGSGRLIAPGLVLTAGHVVDYPTREAPMRTGWKICLMRERSEGGGWVDPPHDAKLVWRGSGKSISHCFGWSGQRHRRRRCDLCSGAGIKWDRSTRSMQRVFRGPRGLTPMKYAITRWAANCGSQRSPNPIRGSAAGRQTGQPRRVEGHVWGCRLQGRAR